MAPTEPHYLEYLGRDEAGGYGFHCPACSRSVRVSLNPFGKTVLFAGDQSAVHGVRIGGLSLQAGPVMVLPAAVTEGDKEFLAGSGISW